MLNNKKLIVVLLSAIAVVSLISFTLINGSGNVVTGAVNNTGAWIGRVFSKPVNGIVTFVDSVDNLMNTFEENQHLKLKIDEIDELQVRVADLDTENERLRQTLDLNQILSQFSITNATVISRNPDQWQETLMIDVGSNHNVERDMAVMAGNGLIGRVIEVNPQSSKVLLLTTQQDSVSKVSARIQTGDDGSSAIGIIDSYDAAKGRYMMTQVDPAAEIEEGEMVITSGLGGVIPSSLLIGEVADSYMDDHGLSQIVEIVPAGEMTDIRFVTVIHQEGQSDE
ncbi:rod shape-determining protein MreC [Aerococcaceae bacterium DSM 111176]|nr:rod shape-determining protein MreC [Aerococcaceae bacterium DSM 111176]